MMKLGWIISLFVFLLVDMPQVHFLPLSKQATVHFGITPLQAQSSRNTKRKRRNSKRSKADRQLFKALNLAKQAQQAKQDGELEIAKRLFEESSMLLFNLRSNPSFKKRRTQIFYILGLMLFHMEMYQVSAFQFSEVVRKQDKKYLTLSIEKLILLTSEILQSSAVLNYSIGKIDLQAFPAEHRNQLRLRIGEVQVGNKQYREAIRTLEKINQDSLVYPKAKYLEGLAYAEDRQPNKALRTFASLVKSRSDFPINDSVRNIGLMGMARAAYQLKDWDRAIRLYRQVPRDTEQWSAALFEMSWAQLRAAQLRFVLGNFHSIHSPYYETNYQPESLILRAILYLYICKYDEMERTLDFFKKVYFPIHQQMRRYLRTRRSPRAVYRDFEKVHSQGSNSDPISIPHLVITDIVKEGNVRNGLSYIQQIQNELQSMQQRSQTWQNSSLGRYSKRLLEKRIRNTQLTLGQNILGHLQRMRTDLSQFVEQHGLARYEMISAKKDQLKRKIVEKKIKKQAIQSERTRDFYVQGGFEYWPFQGEYWLDELGNYYYLGANSCEASIN